MVDVRYWPKADVRWCTANVRFRGVKRTGRRCEVTLTEMKSPWPGVFVGHYGR
jgi:hypothetical protein